MGLESLATADAAFLLEELGIEVTHRPRGVEADGATVRAIFDQEKPQSDMHSGRENVRTGEIQIPEALGVSKDDVWVIRSEEWATTEICGVEAGWRLLKLKKRDAGVRSAKGRPTI